MAEIVELLVGVQLFVAMGGEVLQSDLFKVGVGVKRTGEQNHTLWISI